MTTTRTRIFTKKKETTQSHSLTEFTFHWDGVSENQLMMLAQEALIYHYQCAWLKMGHVPEKFEAKVAELLTPENPAVISPLTYVKKVGVNKLDQLAQALSGLSPEELKALFGEVQK